jgi:hypothetical protein
MVILPSGGTGSPADGVGCSGVFALVVEVVEAAADLEWFDAGEVVSLALLNSLLACESMADDTLECGPFLDVVLAMETESAARLPRGLAQLLGPPGGGLPGGCDDGTCGPNDIARRGWGEHAAADRSHTRVVSCSSRARGQQLRLQPRPARCGARVGQRSGRADGLTPACAGSPR